MNRRLITLLAVGAFAVGALAACSDSDSGSDADSDDSGPDLSAAPVLYEGYESEQYAGTENWICHPNSDDDFCDQDLDATVVTADGLGDVEEYQRADDPPIDCFYVYPTTSEDESMNSDLDWSPDEEGFAVLNQAARLGEVCRVFAPAYRSVTSTGLAGALGGDDVQDALAARDLAFGDVVDAWKQYMANENEGRGVVLVGHSQGSGMLGALISEEIDTQDDVRDRIVGAYLGGWPNPALLAYSGDFENVGVCTATDDVGCVATWASFVSDAPPPAGGLFAQTAAGEEAGSCTNPADPDGGPVAIQTYLPAYAIAAFGLAEADVDTDYIKTEVIVAECVEGDGVHYLSATMNEASLVADFVVNDPAWGMHTVDVSLVQGDVIDMITAQADAWLATRD